MFNWEFDNCLQFFTNQIAQNVDYINSFEFFIPDILHEALGFRTDYQINGEKNVKKIIKNTKK